MYPINTICEFYKQLVASRISKTYTLNMKKLTLHLDGTAPDKLPMARLAEYLRELSTLLGSKEHVHFENVSEGSACLNTLVEDEKYSEVVFHAQQAASGSGSKRARKAYLELTSLMEQDRIDGQLITATGTLIYFPKAKRELPAIVIKKRGSIQGRLYIVGGKDDTVPVRLEGVDGETLLCEANTTMAEELGALLFKYVRLHGLGEWESRPNGGWKLRKLEIHSYQKLEMGGLRAAIRKIKQSGDTNWSEMDAPHAVISELRG